MLKLGLKLVAQDTVTSSESVSISAPLEALLRDLQISYRCLQRVTLQHDTQSGMPCLTWIMPDKKGQKRLMC